MFICCELRCQTGALIDPWLRTMNPAMPPSELVVASALRSTLPEFIAVPALAPDLTKIMAKYRRHDPPDEEEWRAA